MCWRECPSSVSEALEANASELVRAWEPQLATRPQGVMRTDGTQKRTGSTACLPSCEDGAVVGHECQGRHVCVPGRQGKQAGPAHPRKSPRQLQQRTLP